MRKNKKRNESDRSDNYVLIRITTPDGENLLEKEECKKIVSDLRSYIIQHGGKFYKDESIVLVEDRMLLRLIWLRPFAFWRPYGHFNIPSRFIGSNKINYDSKYDIVVFNKRDQ